jgi:V/A-type H+-transporting ATPase subunit A
MSAKGSVVRVAGPVVEAQGMAQAVMHEMVEVGHEGLIGEIIRLEGEYATIQVYQNTAGLKLNEPVTGTGNPLSVELAPGLLGTVFDGIQRPLEELRAVTGPFIKQARGVLPLSRTKKWSFKPKAKVGSTLVSGDVLGTVAETDLVEHRIMVPFNMHGKLVELAPEGKYIITDPIATIEANGTKTKLPMLQKWPVRNPALTAEGSRHPRP